MIRLLSLAAILAAAGWLAWPANDPETVPAAGIAAPPAVTANPQAQQARGASMEFFSAPPPSMHSQAPAAASMAATRAHGDPEAPPIGRADQAIAPPTAQELADPAAYQAYEARQNARVYASYVRAVDAELPILRGDIARGRSLGIAAEKIARAEDKVRRLEQMRAQLLKDHPELAR